MISAALSRFLEVENRVFVDQRVLVYGSTIAGSYAIGVAWLIVHHGLFFGVQPKPCNDFTWMWMSGAFAKSSNPLRVYDPSAWSTLWKTAPGAGSCVPRYYDTHFNYPPTYLLITYLLNRIAYPVSYLGWVIGTLLVYVAAVFAIIPRSATIAAALSPCPIFVTVLLGQNAFLTAGLIGLFLIFLESRPLLAGTLLGLIIYKPQLGLIFPIALLASRNWCALMTATVTSLSLCLASSIAFGLQGWTSFFTSFSDPAHSVLFPGGAANPNDTLYGTLQWLGAAAWVSWPSYLVVAIIVSWSVYAVWAKPVPFTLKAAILCIGVLMMTPYVLAYDYLTLVLAAAYLVKDGLATGFLPGERTVMLVGLISLFFIWVPLEWILCVVLLILVGRRLLAYSRGWIEAVGDESIASPVGEASMPSALR
jgi:Glycosyltransferase family 87